MDYCKAQKHLKNNNFQRQNGNFLLINTYIRVPGYVPDSITRNTRNQKMGRVPEYPGTRVGITTLYILHICISVCTEWSQDWCALCNPKFCNEEWNKLQKFLEGRDFPILEQSRVRRGRNSRVHYGVNSFVDWGALQNDTESTSKTITNTIWRFLQLFSLLSNNHI